MSEPFVDTNVIVRLLTGDDPEKQAQAAALFHLVESGDLSITAPVTVITEAVHVLSSPRMYHLPRIQVRDLLAPLVSLPGFHVPDRRAILRALDLYASTNVGFGDAMIVASMEEAGSQTVYSWDRHLDRFPGISRQAPGALLMDE